MAYIALAAEALALRNEAARLTADNKWHASLVQATGRRIQQHAYSLACELAPQDPWLSGNPQVWAMGHTARRSYDARAAVAADWLAGSTRATAPAGQGVTTPAKQVTKPKRSHTYNLRNSPN